MIASTQTNHPLVGVKNAKDQTPVEVACYKLEGGRPQDHTAARRHTRRPHQGGKADEHRCPPRRLEPNSCDIVRSTGAWPRSNRSGSCGAHSSSTGRASTRSTSVPETLPVVCKQTNKIEELDAASANELRRAVQVVEDTLRSQGYAEVGHIVEFFGKSPAGSPHPGRGHGPRGPYGSRPSDFSAAGVVPAGLVPVDHVPEVCDIVGAPVLVLQVVGPQNPKTPKPQNPLFTSLKYISEFEYK